MTDKNWWNTFNDDYLKSPEKDIEYRQWMEFLQFNNLMEYYKGEFMGFSVLETELYLLDTRLDEDKDPEYEKHISTLLEKRKKEELTEAEVYEIVEWMEGPEPTPERSRKVKIRILIGKNIDFPSGISNRIINALNPENRLAKVISYALNLVFDTTSISLNSNHLNEIFRAVIDRYLEINKQNPDIPITIIFGHGDSDKTSGEHFISSGNYELHPTDFVLDSVYNNYFLEYKGIKPPCVLVSCNNASHPGHIRESGFLVAYAENKLGIFYGTPKIVLID